MTDKPRKQHIFINARFLTQSMTGVQRYAVEVVKVFDTLLENGGIDKNRYSFTMLAPQSIRYKLNLKHISLRCVGHLKGHAWEQLELPFHAKGDLLFCPGNTAPVLSLLTGNPTIVTVHDLSYLYFPDAYSLAFRALYNIVIPLIMRRAAAVITVSESEKKSILTYYKHTKDRLHAIQNGGLASNYLKELESDRTSSTGCGFDSVLYVGSLSRRKNLQGVLKAVSILNERRDVSVVIVGASGKSFHNARFPVPDNIAEKADFKGQINDTREIIKLYRSASCFVFPSFYEASPLPPIEAMSCGCPVIASTIPSLLERCGDAALYCDPDNSVDIAEKIEQVINDRELEETLRQKGLARAGVFTWEECARRTFGIMEKVLEEKRGKQDSIKH